MSNTSHFISPAAPKHVETCVLLVKELVDDDDMVSIKVYLDGISFDQSIRITYEKPTCGNIKKWVHEKHGLSVSNLYIAQIKNKVGLENSCFNNYS